MKHSLQKWYTRNVKLYNSRIKCRKVQTSKLSHTLGSYNKRRLILQTWPTPAMPMCRWVLRQMPQPRWSPINCCRLRCAATTMSGLSIPWCCTSMIYVVFLCNDYHSMFTAVRFFGSVSWRQIWPNYDNLWRLTIKVPDVQWRYWPVTILRVRSFCALSM